jgi:hypothetical protein
MKNLTDVDAFTSPVTVVEGGVDYMTAANQETTAQQLANRTRYLKDKFDAAFPASSTDNAIVRYDGTSGEVVQNSGVIITDSAHVDYVTPKSETIFRAVWNPFVDTAAAQPWVQSVIGAWSTTNVAGQQNTMAVPLPGLRTGMTITGAGVWVGPGAARTATNRISVELFRLDYAGTQTSLATADEDDGTTAYQFVGPTGLSVVVDTSQYDYFLLVTSGNTAATDLCGAIEVGVDVSGLRGT